MTKEKNFKIKIEETKTTKRKYLIALEEIKHILCSELITRGFTLLPDKIQIEYKEGSAEREFIGLYFVEVDKKIETINAV